MSPLFIGNEAEIQYVKQLKREQLSTILPHHPGFLQAGILELCSPKSNKEELLKITLPGLTPEIQTQWLPTRWDPGWGPGISLF